MGLLELPDLRHTLVDIGTTLLCISGYNGLPGRTLPINLIHDTVRPNDGKDPFLHVLEIASRYLGKLAKTAEAYSSIEPISAQ